MALVVTAVPQLAPDDEGTTSTTAVADTAPGSTDAATTASETVPDAVTDPVPDTGADPAPGTAPGSGGSTSSTAGGPWSQSGGDVTNAAGKRFVFPVGGRCAYVDTYGAPRAGGRSHVGVDIIAPQGKPLFAVTDGKVYRMSYVGGGSNTLGGNSLHLRDADGTNTYYYYAHLVAFADGIKVGVNVRAGQLLGFVGMTGNASAPHLHFEVHPNGNSTANPYPYVKAVDACRTEVTSPVWNGIPSAAGTVTPSGSSATASPWTSGPSSVPRGFVPISPARLVDTRVGTGLSGRLAAGRTTTIVAGGKAGVPANATWVHVNLVSVDPSSTGAVTIVPCNSTPRTAVLNVAPSTVMGTSAVAGLTNGAFCIQSSVKTHLVIDVMGYSTTGTGTGLVQLTPTRTYDSRLTGGTRFVPQQARSVRVVGFPGIAGDAIAASLNVTVVNAAQAGYITAWPCGSAQPATSILNFGAGEVIGNSVNIGVGSNGSVCFSSNTSGHLVVDITGIWMGSRGDTLQAIAPVRVLDTAAAGTQLRAHETREITVAGAAGVPATTRNAAMSITVSNAGAPGFITAWPCGRPKPLASSINFVPRRTSSNATLQALGNGRLCVYSNTSVDVVLEVVAVTA